MKITKRNGNIVLYDDEKIVASVLKANEGTFEDLSEKTVAYMADAVLGRIAKKYDVVTTELLREGIYEELKDRGLILTAESYKNYIKQK